MMAHCNPTFTASITALAVSEGLVATAIMAAAPLQEATVPLAVTRSECMEQDSVTTAVLAAMAPDWVVLEALGINRVRID